MGAIFARPEAAVFAICGDGGFQMNVQELATAVNWGLPLKIVILNNGFLGMVRQWQELFHEKRYSYTCLHHNNPDFVKLAESFGAVGLRADKPEDVEPLIKQAMKINDKPVVTDFIVERDENVMPMVPAGGALDEMILA
jgi:acetolactate synthase-1/2/3 large subunit